VAPSTAITRLPSRTVAITRLPSQTVAAPSRGNHSIAGNLQLSVLNHLQPRSNSRRTLKATNATSETQSSRKRHFRNDFVKRFGKKARKKKKHADEYHEDQIND